MGNTYRRQKTRDFDRDDYDFERRGKKKDKSSGKRPIKTLNRVVEYDEYETNPKYENPKTN
jgi:hypothetical protein